MEQQPAREEALRIILERRAEVQACAASESQSERGKLFEMIVDLTDDDGTIADFEDFADWLDDRE